MAEKQDKKKKSAPKQQPERVAQKVNSNRLELLVTIVSRQKAEFFADLIQSFDVNLQMIVRAEGTANAEMLSLIGLPDAQKSVIFSVIREERVADALNSIEHKFKTIKNGKGIAYTVPMTSLIGVAVYGFLSNNERAAKE
ncbi:MAG: hypothetical protein J5713_04240 [Clostridia bacterium]|nr:hypothetical protein [Clostridia bacterium]